MDIGLARTFLTIVATGSFQRAAEKLGLTQTAVSARVRTMEEELRRPLFIRNKAGARLTLAGERFLRHATQLVQTWENARRQIAMPDGRSEGVSIGAELSLCDPSLTDWLVRMRRERPDIAVRAEVDSGPRLLEKIREGALDMAVLHNPSLEAELAAELLCEEKLVLVTTDADGAMDPEKYISVDWGSAFAASHQAADATPANPAVSIGLGPLARNYILAVGGSGYFRLGSVQTYLDQGRLQLVAGAPEFAHSIYLAYSARHDKGLIELVRASLRDCFAIRRKDDRPQAPSRASADE